MDQNEPKDKNGNDLNEKKLPGDPVSLYIVSFFGTEWDLTVASFLDFKIQNGVFRDFRP